MARERYVDQVRLLVDILPAVAAEEVFALKGGTAINLFYRDLPRLSVTADDLEHVRQRLIKDVQSRLVDTSVHFLRGLVEGEPDFDAIGLPSAALLPAVRWKLQNIKKLRATNFEKYALQRAGLERLLS